MFRVAIGVQYWIQELESLLQVRLVDRTNKRVIVTRIGAEIATQARLCLRKDQRKIQ